MEAPLVIESGRRHPGGENLSVGLVELGSAALPPSTGRARHFGLSPWPPGDSDGIRPAALLQRDCVLYAGR